MASLRCPCGTPSRRRARSYGSREALTSRPLRSGPVSPIAAGYRADGSAVTLRVEIDASWRVDIAASTLGGASPKPDLPRAVSREPAVGAVGSYRRGEHDLRAAPHLTEPLVPLVATDRPRPGSARCAPEEAEAAALRDVGRRPEGEAEDAGLAMLGDHRRELLHGEPEVTAPSASCSRTACTFKACPPPEARSSVTSHAAAHDAITTMASGPRSPQARLARPWRPTRHAGESLRPRPPPPPRCVTRRLDSRQNGGATRALTGSGGLRGWRCVTRAFADTLCGWRLSARVFADTLCRATGTSRRAAGAADAR